MDIYHNHHIIPKHMGGSDEPSNLIKLTIEEHAEAHKILYETYGKIEDLWAYQLLSNQITYKEGFKKILTKNAMDTHRKQKEKGTGLYNSKMQSEKGKLGAIKSQLGIKNNANYIKVSCISCKKETSVPTLHGHHYRKCFLIADGQNRAGRTVNRTVQVHAVGGSGTLVIRVSVRNSGIGVAFLKLKLEGGICLGDKLALKNHKSIVPGALRTVATQDISQALADTATHANTKGGACSALGDATEMAAKIFDGTLVSGQFRVKGLADQVDQIPSHEQVGFLAKKRIRKASCVTAVDPDLAVTEVSNSRGGIIETVLVLAAGTDNKCLTLLVSQLDFIHGEVILLK